jgi:hypothetical protein
VTGIDFMVQVTKYQEQSIWKELRKEEPNPSRHKLRLGFFPYF